MFQYLMHSCPFTHANLTESVAEKMLFSDTFIGWSPYCARKQDQLEIETTKEIEIESRWLKYQGTLSLVITKSVLGCNLSPVTHEYKTPRPSIVMEHASLIKVSYGIKPLPHPNRVQEMASSSISTTAVPSAFFVPINEKLTKSNYLL
jgi:hypothetical protein